MICIHVWAIREELTCFVTVSTTLRQRSLPCPVPVYCITVSRTACTDFLSITDTPFQIFHISMAFHPAEHATNALPSIRLQNYIACNYFCSLIVFSFTNPLLHLQSIITPFLTSVHTRELNCTIFVSSVQLLNDDQYKPGFYPLILDDKRTCGMNAQVQSFASKDKGEFTVPVNQKVLIQYWKHSSPG